MHARIGNVDETFAMMDKGLALFDELVRERPGDSRIATGRVDALLAFHAALYAGAREGLNAGKVDESPALLKKADALYAHLSGERPNDPKVQAARWNEVLGLAGFDRDSGRWPECFRILRDAESTAQLLARDARPAARPTDSRLWPWPESAPSTASSPSGRKLPAHCARHMRSTPMA